MAISMILGAQLVQVMTQFSNIKLQKLRRFGHMGYLNTEYKQVFLLLLFFVGSRLGNYSGNAPSFSVRQDRTRKKSKVLHTCQQCDRVQSHDIYFRQRDRVRKALAKSQFSGVLFLYFIYIYVCIYFKYTSSLF